MAGKVVFGRRGRIGLRMPVHLQLNFVLFLNHIITLSNIRAGIIRHRGLAKGDHVECGDGLEGRGSERECEPATILSPDYSTTSHMKALMRREGAKDCRGIVIISLLARYRHTIA